MKRLIAATLMVFASVFAQTSSNVENALEEIQTQINTPLVCLAPVVWEVKGDLRAAAESLVAEITKRGWGVLHHGPLQLSYAVLIDPEPNNPKAYAVGGLTPNGSPDSHYVFLAECTATATVLPSENFAHRPTRPNG